MAMKGNAIPFESRRRAFLLRLIGAALLALGLLAAVLGPVEMYCFYLFSEGGRFHYEGFRFGSFMFGNLAAQVLGYYFIATLLLPIGYGTLRLRRWARHLALAMLQFWVVAGLPLIVACFFVLISSKDAAWPVILLAGILLAASYLLLPGLGERFYNHPRTKAIFEAGGIGLTWIETIPVPLLGLGFVFAFFILILHAQIFFNGVFPLFGVWLRGLQGIMFIEGGILSLLAILWGTLRARRWAWWAAMLYFCTLAICYITTLLSSSWAAMLAAANFPALEMEMLQGMPLHGYHFAVLAGLPFLLVIYLIVRARPSFNAAHL
jgi:hypothetical protein